MRVFVVGTGRYGSVSFRESCRFLTNYSTGHETRCGLLEYPDNFIEVNPQLRKCIVFLSGKYPDAKWVHLIREKEPCVRSIARLSGGAVMRAYEDMYPTIMMTGDASDVADRYYDCENDATSIQLTAVVPAEQRMVIRLETVKTQWPEFLRWIGAEGDLDRSLKSWDTKRNTGESRGET